MWKSAWHTTLQSLSLILVFQFGFIGTVFFLTFFYILTNRMVLKLNSVNKDSQLYLLTGSCILSFVAFLVNEVKFEFNRSDSYQQVIWLLFAGIMVFKILIWKALNQFISQEKLIWQQEA